MEEKIEEFSIDARKDTNTTLFASYSRYVEKNVLKLGERISIF